MVDILDPATGKVTKSTYRSAVDTIDLVGSSSHFHNTVEDQITQQLAAIQGDLDRFQAGLNKNALDRLKMEDKEAAKFTGDGLSNYLETKAKPFKDEEKRITGAITSHIGANTSADEQGVKKIVQGMVSQARREAEKTLEKEKVQAVLGTMPKDISYSPEGGTGHGNVPNLKGGALKK